MATEETGSRGTLRGDVLSPEEITKIATTLAIKFKSAEHFDDLVSEGILEYYENQDKDTLYQRMRRRMHDYLNIKTKGISVPTSSIARQIARDEHTEATGNLSPTTLEALKIALRGHYIEYEEGEADEVDVEEYIFRTQMAEQMLGIINTKLTKKQQQIINLRYYQDMTQEEVADFLGISQQSVQQRETAALNKMFQHLDQLLLHTL